MYKIIIDWLVQSTWFKKYSAALGGFFLGMWMMTSYYKQIYAILRIVGISRDEFINLLLMIIGATGIAASVGLSLEKTRRAKKKLKKEKVNDLETIN